VLTLHGSTRQLTISSSQSANIIQITDKHWSSLYLVGAFNGTRKTNNLGLLFIVLMGIKRPLRNIGKITLLVVKATLTYKCLFFLGERILVSGFEIHVYQNKVCKSLDYKHSYNGTCIFKTVLPKEKTDRWSRHMFAQFHRHIIFGLIHL